MDGGPLPDTRQVLCQHLHAKVRYLNPALADQVTVVLADGKSNREIIDLLTTDSLLEENVEKVIVSLSECNSEVRESLGAAVFQAVAELEQELCAQVTGMLLELPGAALTHLLSHPAALSQAVSRARAEYLAYLQVDNDQGCTEQEGLSRLSTHNREEIERKDKEEARESQRSWFGLKRTEEVVVKGQVVQLSGLSKKEENREEKCSGFSRQEKERTEKQEDSEQRNKEEEGEERYSRFRRDVGVEESEYPDWSGEKEAVGEALYYTLSAWHPHLAPRLTGMLLQMDLPHLLKLVADPALLRAKTKLALAAINDEQHQDSSNPGWAGQH